MLLFRLAASYVALGETKNWCHLVIEQINIDFQFIIVNELSASFFFFLLKFGL